MSLYQEIENLAEIMNPDFERENFMPLKKSVSRKAFKENVDKEIASGKDPKHAVAIAYSVKREARKKGKK